MKNLLIAPRALARNYAAFSCCAVLSCGVMLGCNVENTTRDTGGVGGKSDAASCPSGVSVVLSDYMSTQVALSSSSGETQSESLISTGSTKTDGLAFALSGDVTLPSQRPSSGNVVLLDRFGTNVITWVDPTQGDVIAQLAVGTGFESNPSDYLEVSETEAFVTRWGDNTNAGAQQYDRGGDVLFIDLESHSISGALELPLQAEGEAETYPARPGGMTRIGDTVWIALGRLSADYSSMGEALLVGVSVKTHEIGQVMNLSGLKDCGQLAVSPDGKRAAVACSGHLTETGEIEALGESALVLFEVTQGGLKEVERLDTEQLGVEGLQNDVVFASDAYLLLKSQTPYGGSSNNRWLALELATEQVSTLLEARTDEQGKGKGLSYAGMTCSPGCSDICLLADSDRGVLQRVQVQANAAPQLLEAIEVETRVGLPPRDIVAR